MRLTPFKLGIIDTKRFGISPYMRPRTFWQVVKLKKLSGRRLHDYISGTMKGSRQGS